MGGLPTGLSYQIHIVRTAYRFSLTPARVQDNEEGVMYKDLASGSSRPITMAV